MQKFQHMVAQLPDKVALLMVKVLVPETVPTWPGGQNIVQYFDLPPIIDDKVLFAFHTFTW